MKIIKYCKKKYRIDKTNNIQIGTLNYYRNHSNKLIVDPLEGKSDGLTIISTKTIIMSNSDYRFFSIMYPKSFTSTHRFILKKDVVMIFPNAPKFPNVYIFCCTIEKDGNETTAKSLGYDSFYVIKDPEKFSKIIAKQLKKLAKLKNPKTHWKIKRWYQQVNYNEDNQITLTDTSEMIKLVFHKIRFSSHDVNIDFKKNKEYRFVWLFKNSQNDPLEVEDEPINITELKKIKEVCDESKSI